MRRRLNWKLLIVLALGLAIGGGAVHLVHGYQVTRTADFLRVRSEQAERRGDFNEAASYLVRYLTLRPDSDEAFADYGLLLDRQAVTPADRFRTLQILERAAGRAPERTDLRQRIIALAMSPEIHRFRTARDQLLVLLKATPEDGDLEGQLGRCLEAFASGEDADTKQGGDRGALAAEAARAYESSIQHAPGRIESYVHLAALLRGPLRDERRADRIMAARGAEAGQADLITANPQSAAAYLARAQYRRQYQIDGARADLDRALSLAPTDADGLLAAATLAQAEGRGDEARRHLAEAIKAHPTDQRMYLTLAALEAQAGQFAAAVTCLRGGLQRLPDRGILQWSLADNLIRANEPTEASTLIDQMRHRREILGPAIDYLAARVLLIQGKLAAGIDLLDRTRASMTGVIQNADLIKQTDLLLAEGYERLGNPDRQIAACRRVLQADPQSAPARLGLASGLLAEGRVAEAITASREAIPVDGSARLLLARILTAQNLQLPAENRNWGEVTALLDAIEPATPDDPAPGLLRAQVLAAQGEERQARDLLTRLRDRHPDQVGLWFALAVEAQIRGKPADGLAILDEAQRRLGDSVDLRLSRIQLLSRRGDESHAALLALSRDLDGFTAADRARLEDGLAQAFAQIGDNPTAARLWTRVLDARPDDLRVAALLTDLALQAEPSADRPATIQRAIARLRQLEGAEGTSWRRAEALRLIDLARQGDRGRIAEAREIVKEIRSRRQNWSLVALLEADLDEVAGDPDGALSAYRKAIEQGETRPEVIRRTVALLTQKNQTAEADRLVRRMIDQTPPSGQLARLAAEMALRHEDRDEAIRFARQAVPAGSVDPGDHLWLGRVLQTSGQTEAAETEFRRAIALDPRRPEPPVALVRLLATQRRTADAEVVLTEAQQTLPPDAAPVALGLGYEAIGRPDQAREQWHTALARDPNNPARQLAFASFLIRTRQFAPAETTLRAVLDPASPATPRDRELARRDLALCLTMRGSGPLAEALEWVDLNLRADPQSVADLQIKALILQKRSGDQREAIRVWENLARLTSLSAGEKLMLARLYAAGPDWFQGRDILQGLLASEPTDPELIAALARLFLDHDQPAKASELVDRLEAIQPRALVTLDLKAQLLGHQGQGAAAVALLEGQARTDPASRLPLAATLERIGQPDAAERLYRQVAAGSDQPEAILALALFLGRRGQTRAALDVCQVVWARQPSPQVSNACLQILGANRTDATEPTRVADWLTRQLEREPTNPAYLFDLANVEDIRGHYDEAESLLRRVIAQAPQSSGPLNNLAWLLAVRGGKVDEALGLINRAIAIDGPDPDLLDTRSLVYLAQNQADRAIQDLEHAAASKPSPITYFHLAQAQNEAGNRQASRETFHKAQAEGLNERIVHPFERPRLRQLTAELGPGQPR